jgi:hypothetical protein
VQIQGRKLHGETRQALHAFQTPDPIPALSVFEGQENTGCRAKIVPWCNLFTSCMPRPSQASLPQHTYRKWQHKFENATNQLYLCYLCLYFYLYLHIKDKLENDNTVFIRSTSLSVYRAYRSRPTLPGRQWRVVVWLDVLLDAPVVSGRPLRNRAVAGVSQWARAARTIQLFHTINRSLVLGPLNSLLW